MGKYKSRFHASKQAKARGASTLAYQAPVTELSRPCDKILLESEPGEACVGPKSNTDKGAVTDNNLAVDGGPKIRKRNREGGKSLLVGSSRRRLAGASLKGQRKLAGKAVGNKKKKARRGLYTTVQKAPTEYGDERKTTVVYTDGACSSNGKCNAAAGIGVWWNAGDKRNISERCPGPQTNNRAEIFAVVRLLEEAPMTGEQTRLVIRTDSMYTINCVRNWAPKWETQGWKRASGEEVKNAGMIQYLLALLSLRATQGEIVVFEHVQGHSNNIGNDAADALAKRGTTDPIIPERLWLAGQRRVESVEAKIRLSKAVAKTKIQDQLHFVIKESDCLTSRELEELERTQEF